MKTGFDNELYKKQQKEAIVNRFKAFDKLYLEFGGKLFDDLHAARVLPGFEPDVKTQILAELKDQCEIIFCISALDIEKNKLRGDFGITYDAELLRLMKKLRALGLTISSVVITQFTGQNAARVFKNKLEILGERVYIHTFTKGYPNEVDVIVSDEGYGANPYIETTHPLVIVTAPGPGSGKLATCLSQLYHEYKRDKKAGYAKFETFPVWDLPLKHPVNVAYEAATVDLNDRNLIDFFHLDAHGVMAVNYNRDLEVFPVVKTILERILGTESPYKSPTDMGVNKVGKAIADDEAVCVAAKQEIIRRFYSVYGDYKHGRVDLAAAHRVEILMNDLKIKISDRKVVQPCLDKAKLSGGPAMAIELKDGTIITGKQTAQVKATAAVIINAIKTLSNIDDAMNLITPAAISAIKKLKTDTLHFNNNKLNLEEALIAMSFSAASNPIVDFALSKLKCLKCCEAHSSVMLEENEAQIFRRLGINLTSEPEFAQ